MLKLDRSEGIAGVWRLTRLGRMVESGQSVSVSNDLSESIEYRCVSGSYLRIIEAGILAPGVSSTFFYMKSKQSDKSGTVSQLGKEETDLCGSCIGSQHANIQRFVTI